MEKMHLVTAEDEAAQVYGQQQVPLVLVPGNTGI